MRRITNGLLIAGALLVGCYYQPGETVSLSDLDRGGAAARPTDPTGEEIGKPPVASPAPPSPAVDSPAEWTPPPEWLGSYHALLIGNARYRHLPSLATPAGDVRAIAEVLEQDYGFETRVVIDADRDTMIAELDRLRARLGPGDNLLLFYAGHGWLDEAADRGYWLPVDARDSSRTRWLSNSDVTDTLYALQAKHVLVVADSCFSGTLTRGVNIVDRGPGYIERLAKKRARLVLTSGGLETVTDRRGEGHSAFARAFLDALEANGTVEDGTAFFQHVREGVMRRTGGQTPQYSDLRTAGHAGGDFLFYRRAP